MYMRIKFKHSPDEALRDWFATVLVSRQELLALRNGVATETDSLVVQNVVYV
jgi:hypothetical protein